MTADLRSREFVDIKGRRATEAGDHPCVTARAHDHRKRATVVRRRGPADHCGQQRIDPWLVE